MDSFRSWLIQLCAEMDKQPQEELFKILEGRGADENLTTAVVNNARTYLGRVFTKQGPNTHSSEIKMARHLYFHFLSMIIREQLMKQEGSMFVNVEETGRERLKNAHTHNALLCCCAEIIAQAFQGREFSWVMELPGTNTKLHAIELWIVIEYLLECPASSQLPSELIAVLQSMQSVLLTKYVFEEKCSTFTYLLEGGGCLHLPGEKTMTRRFLLAFANHVLEHTEHLANDVIGDIQMQQEELSFVHRCMTAVDRVLYHDLDLFFHRSIFVPILCGISFVGEKSGMSITLDDLCRRCRELYPSVSPNDFGLVLLKIPDGPECKPCYVTIGQFYTLEFLPTCKRTASPLNSQS